MIIFYQFIGFLLIPLIKLHIFLRILKQKEDHQRYFERYGISKIERPKGNLIWIHASSVGEFKSTAVIINKLYKNFTILVTTTTLAASTYAINHFGNKIIHQYAPFDVLIWVNRFLEKWKPSFVLWVESDLWPTTLMMIKKKSIKSFLINSRISPKSYNRWKYIQKFFRKITNTFDEIYAQSKLDKKRLELLTKRKINFIGNLKFASIEKLTNKIVHAKLQKKLNDYKVIMFASTHNGEEKIFIKTIKKLLSLNKNIKIIIAPRHINRSISILDIFNKENIRSNLFEDSINLEEDVLIINSLGKMTLYYSLSDIVILGGSFIKSGGHNPVEPAHNNCVVITGPHIYNWENIFLEMKYNNSCLLCANILELDKYLIDLFIDIEKINILKIKAKKFADNSFFEIEKLITKIDNHIKLM